MSVQPIGLVACDHQAFLRCIGKAMDCNLWATAASMLSSPQAAHVRSHGEKATLQELEIYEVRVMDATRIACARGEALEDDPVPGNPITLYLEVLRHGRAFT